MNVPANRIERVNSMKLWKCIYSSVFIIVMSSCSTQVQSNNVHTLHYKGEPSLREKRTVEHSLSIELSIGGANCASEIAGGDVYVEYVHLSGKLMQRAFHVGKLDGNGNLSTKIVDLNIRSRGGNPYIYVVVYKNDEPIRNNAFSLHALPYEHVEEVSDRRTVTGTIFKLNIVGC